jgi:DNA-binding CsgD family transcriptional regulator
VNAHAEPSDRDAAKRRRASANPGRLRGRVTSLTDRRTERGTLEGLVDTVRAGESAALVVRGDPGVGKTALLDHLAKRASGSGCQVARATGVQSEMELAFAGLHQLCAPMLNRAERVPEPQRDALRTAFGIAAGPPPDRFLVGLAVLSLLSGVAGERPLICLIDDEQWLDRASAQALGFTARRLAADPVGLVFAARDPSADLAGLPELEVGGLRDDDARVLLDSALAGPLDPRVRDLIIAETRGNPLAMLELPRGLSPAELAGGFGLLGAAPLTSRIEDSFRRQLDALPAETQRLLQLAAADPSGDRALVFRAARRLGIPVRAGVLAAEAGLAEFGGQVRFRHPLARSAVYRSASLSERQQMHAALAEVTDPQADPDRRAWHRAQAADGPDEEVAAELEHSAGRAQARGGMAAAAAFLERSVLLTDDPARRAERALAAAQASMQAAAFGQALELLATAESGPLDDFASARVDLLRGLIAFASSMGGDAPSLLLKAAKRLEPLNLGLARETYLNAWRAASFGGSMAGDGDMLKVSRAARALPPPADPARPIDLILDGLTRLVTDGPAAAGPALRRAVNVFVTGDVPREEGLWSGWMAATVLWDADAARTIITRQINLGRAVGALEELPFDLIALTYDDAWRGDFEAASSLIAETDTIAEATGSRIPPFPAMLLAALRGRQAELLPLAAAVKAAAEAAGQGAAVTNVHWSIAILENGFGHYAEALAAAGQARDDSHLFVSTWALPELVEAAVRTGGTEVAAAAIEQLAERTQAGGTDFGLGLEARCRALVSQGQAAEACYREAVERLSRAGMRAELARAYLLYGEWLRREDRRLDAREQLRTAHDMLTAIGMEAFAERARRELVATGEAVRKRGADTVTMLTPQEAYIARLARDGLTNPEIGAQLFLSARTVEWHLRKIFTKLGIGSRRELHAALAGHGQDGQPA